MNKILTLLLGLLAIANINAQKSKKPNVLIIYTDDLGYGDLRSYGAKSINTPNIDALANNGLKFTNAYATNATCTPSRYSLLTGTYSWRRNDTGVANGDASLIINEDTYTLADLFRDSGYATGVIGKWHLGIGDKEGPNWNGTLKPGPLELGFNYSYIMAATQDRVPCVYIDGHQVENLDPADPITVNYKGPIPNANIPTYKEHPELLEMTSSNGHNNSVINGIGRIGYMSGGKAAIWDDYSMNEHFADKASKFITEHKDEPFFLYYATPNIHVPRTPNKKFAGKSGMGPRGDVILELDYCVGQVIKTLDSLGIRDNTLIVFSSDNGPVIDDGYNDQAKQLLGNHRPAGNLRGGKYSIFEGGTRIPFIVNYPKKIKKGETNTLISQIDLFASFASLNKQNLKQGQAFDSFNMLNQLLGKSKENRPYLIEDAYGIAIIKDSWKYIKPNNRSSYLKETETELGNNPQPQLYDLRTDEEEKINIAAKHPEKVKELAALLDEVMKKPISQ